MSPWQVATLNYDLAGHTRIVGVQEEAISKLMYVCGSP